MSYSVIAGYYDSLQEADYEAIGAYYHELLLKGGASSGILLDLACGTGTLTRRFVELGYDVIGADISPEMLTIASQKPKKNIQYLCQDMTRLDLFGTIDACICTLDAFNHLPSLEAVAKTLSRISLFLNKGGVLAFDMNTPYKHREVLAVSTYIFDTDDVYCVWRNSCCDDDDNYRVDMTLDIFGYSHDADTYQRRIEYITERAYPLVEITKLLEVSGFRNVEAFDWLTDKSAHEMCEKAVFTAIKK